jgi:hypothetical protein
MRGFASPGSIEESASDRTWGCSRCSLLREVDVGVEELVDQRANGIGFREGCELVAELEVVEDVLDVGRKAVEVVLEIGEQLLLAAAGLQIA